MKTRKRINKLKKKGGEGSVSGRSMASDISEISMNSRITGRKRDSDYINTREQQKKARIPFMLQNSKLTGNKRKHYIGDNESITPSISQISMNNIQSLNNNKRGKYINSYRSRSKSRSKSQTRSKSKENIKPFFTQSNIDYQLDQNCQTKIDRNDDDTEDTNALVKFINGTSPSPEDDLNPSRSPGDDAVVNPNKNNNDVKDYIDTIIHDISTKNSIELETLYQKKAIDIVSEIEKNISPIIPSVQDEKIVLESSRASIANSGDLRSKMCHDSGSSGFTQTLFDTFKRFPEFKKTYMDNIKNDYHFFSKTLANSSNKHVKNIHSFKFDMLKTLITPGHEYLNNTYVKVKKGRNTIDYKINSYDNESKKYVLSSPSEENIEEDHAYVIGNLSELHDLRELFETTLSSTTKGQFDSIWGSSVSKYALQSDNNKSSSIKKVTKNTIEPFKPICYICGGNLVKYPTANMEHKMFALQTFTNTPYHKNYTKKYIIGKNNYNDLWKKFIKKGNKSIHDYYISLNETDQFNTQAFLDQKFNNIIEEFIIFIKSSIKDLSFTPITNTIMNNKLPTWDMCTAISKQWLIEFAYSHDTCNKVKSNTDWVNLNDDGYKEELNKILKAAESNKTKPDKLQESDIIINSLNDNLVNRANYLKSHFKYLQDNIEHLYKNEEIKIKNSEKKHIIFLIMLKNFRTMCKEHDFLKGFVNKGIVNVISKKPKASKKTKDVSIKKPKSVSIKKPKVLKSSNNSSKISKKK